MTELSYSIGSFLCLLFFATPTWKWAEMVRKTFYEISWLLTEVCSISCSLCLSSLKFFWERQRYVATILTLWSFLICTLILLMSKVLTFKYFCFKLLLLLREENIRIKHANYQCPFFFSSLLVKPDISTKLLEKNFQKIFCAASPLQCYSQQNFLMAILVLIYYSFWSFPKWKTLDLWCNSIHILSQLRSTFSWRYIKKTPNIFMYFRYIICIFYKFI